MTTANNTQSIPFNEAQQAWLSGFFAGMHSHILQSAGSGDAANARTITILYGSQTGNSESVANDAAQVAKAHGLNTKVLGMDEIERDAFINLEYLLIITSTYGEGDMPDNAQMLWEAISSDDSISLANMKYSVLALGDTSYDLFCQAGIDWDQCLTKLGATCLVERVDCDVDFDEAAESWISNVIPLMTNGTTTQGKIFIQEGSSDTFSATGTVKFGRKNPFPGKLVANRLLTSPNSSKEIRHYEISIAGSGLSYEAGDALNVVPTNCPELVADIIKAMGCTGDEEEPVHGELMPLSEALREHYEIKLPSKELLDEIAKRSGDQELNSVLASNDKDKLAKYLWGRDTLDLLLPFPDMQFSAAEFLALLKPLQHRAYSISSSGKAYPETVHLTISSVRYHSFGREHKGVCSTYLADLADENTPIRCFFSPNKVFRVPEDNDSPMIMVGPGTGIAPFRAFLQEREFRQAKGINWLFFGDRNAATDYIYQDEIEAMQNSKLLTKLDLAFSRDQEEKIYVQDRMREKGAELFALLEQGGYFFVCGDAYRMAKDVDKALHDIIATHGNKSAEQAIEYVNQMKKDKRYVRDVY
ncbi:diflavin oxidoreductase [methanotrophic endosymbiont of Bathymodiolus puteoserpentis (Logatchev)]|jgi:sulfite reductase (NADPH) flavoprotein alpha-component|uniref:diflavin oxidoreductase n=1 Tax=methanotrophic endosymbiont of Bathymodiolus puteoserpentis (Logatchev) TaxID=343235 RepID=UPI0013CA0C21|nr:sulfite reductase flavoprotein subunit alpha [methanotrophic endosymbiont of Bathymodiolus puteoserpentis (Logatchev)]SHE20566.1 Sulfite reductase [NADPH] flavoprotein alpha-component [methanotrophic endosymbiont of Bathymodiolus puteoserpentis (Logatchev)]